MIIIDNAAQFTRLKQDDNFVPGVSEASKPYIEVSNRILGVYLSKHGYVPVVFSHALYHKREVEVRSLQSTEMEKLKDYLAQEKL